MSMRLRAAGLVALVMFMSAAAGPPGALGSDVALRYFVTFHDEMPSAGATWHEATIVARYADTGAWVVEATSTQVSAIRDDPDVRFVELDQPLRLSSVPNDPKWSQQWGPQAVQATDAWDVSHGAPTVRVAVLDTGFDSDHPDRPAHLVLGPDYGDGDSNPEDANGHGTWTAGIIAAARDNGIGVAGIANVEVYVIKVFGDDGTGYVSDLDRGLQRALQANAQIVSMSLAFDEASPAIAARVVQLANAGILMIAGAGNEAGGPVLLPAAYPEVVAVTSVNEVLAVAEHASMGSEIELAAPGVGVKNLWRGGGYASTSGTSAAAPHVAGAAGLIWSLAPQLSAAEVRLALTATALDLGDVGRDNASGHGLIQMYDALTSVFDRLPGYSLDDSAPILVAEGTSLTWNVGAVPVGSRGFDWAFVDESGATGASGAVVDVMAAVDGTNNILLTYLEDGVLREKTRSFVVTNVAPTLDSISGPTDAPVGRTVALSVVAFDPADPLTYTFDWGDGSTTETTESSAAHAYAQQGRHTILVTVRDGDGGVATGTHPMAIGDDLRFVPGSLVVEARPLLALTTLGGVISHPMQHTVRGILVVDSGGPLADLPVDIWVHRNGDRRLVGTLSLDAPGSGLQEIPFEMALDMTTAWPTGTYMVDAIADAQRTVEERIETNNLIRATFDHPRT